MSSDTDNQEKSLADIWELLHAINLKLENHIVEEETYKPKLIKAVEVLEQSKGVITFLKFAVWFTGIVWVVSQWAKDHFKW